MLLDINPKSDNIQLQMTLDGLVLHKTELEINDPTLVVQLPVLPHTETGAFKSTFIGSFGLCFSSSSGFSTWSNFLTSYTEWGDKISFSFSSEMDQLECQV